MKLIVQIPCFNEAQTLPRTLEDIPDQIEGITTLEILVIDDGSTDETVETARQHGVDHVVQHSMNRGLARAFETGLEECLRRGADIVVNTDADNQYPGAAISDLIRPIVNGEADIVIGDRQTHLVTHFSPVKKLLQSLGSLVVRFASGTDVRDAPSGFRAFSRDAALKISIFTNYTYTLETIIQAGKKGMIIAQIPIEVNGPVRESRLIKSNRSYILRSITTILRLFLLYEPLKAFAATSIPFFLIGIIFWLRYLVLGFLGETARASNLQSIVVGAVALLTGILLVAIGMVGDVLAMNRTLNESILYRLKRVELEKDRSDLSFK